STYPATEALNGGSRLSTGLRLLESLAGGDLQPARVHHRAGDPFAAQFGAGRLRALRGEMQDAGAVELGGIVLGRREDLVRLALRDRQTGDIARRLLGRRLVMKGAELDRPIRAAACLVRQWRGFGLGNRRQVP